MKLLRKTFGLHAAVSLGILMVAAAVMFIALRVMGREEADDQLLERAERIIRKLEQGRYRGEEGVHIEHVKTIHGEERVFSDLLLPEADEADTEEVELEPWRELRLLRRTDVGPVAVTVRMSMIEWEDFLETILTVFIGTSVLLVFGGFLASAAVSRRIWRPFFQNLDALAGFSARREEPMSWAESDIEEFRELTASLDSLTERTRREYRILKEFSENASHELQTPLAVISVKLDQLRQHPGLSSEAAGQLEEAAGAADRLARLNRDLLLLTNLENNRFDWSATCPMSDIVAGQTRIAGEVHSGRNRSVTSEISHDVQVTGNTMLCEILVGNLLGNALRHAEGEGSVHVRLSAEQFSVSNPGPPLPAPVEDLYARFRKGRQDMSSAGLGLSIVREIVRLHGWRLDYDYESARHVFTVIFV